MKDLEFLKLFGDIDCDMVCECLPARAGKKPQKTVRTVPRFLSRAASVAAAVMLALFISTATAEAAGVRVVMPFVSWTGSTLRLDYSAGLDKHEDAPEITAPDVIVTEEGTDGERFVTESESELHLLAGNKLRFPGNEAGLEFVSAKGIIDDEDNEKLNWLKRKIDWLDPFIDYEDELLTEEDKQNLVFPESENDYHRTSYSSYNSYSAMAPRFTFWNNPFRRR